jgi:ankyrin repeat protein
VKQEEGFFEFVISDFTHRLARVEGFRASLRVERDYWRMFPENFARESADEFVRDTERLIDECMENLLRVEAVQMEKIGQFEEIQAFSEKKLIAASLESSSEETRNVDAFCRACENGDLEMVQSMLKAIRGKRKRLAFAVARDASGATGAHFACQNGHAQVVAELLRIGVPVFLVDSWHNVPLAFWAVSSPSIACDSVLAELADSNGVHVTAKGRSVLHFATRFGNFVAVTALIEKFNVSVKDVEESTGRTALHISCSRGYMGVRHFLSLRFSLTRSPRSRHTFFRKEQIRWLGTKLARAHCTRPTCAKTPQLSCS